MEDEKDSLMGEGGLIRVFSLPALIWFLNVNNECAGAGGKIAQEVEIALLDILGRDVLSTFSKSCLNFFFNQKLADQNSSKAFPFGLKCSYLYDNLKNTCILIGSSVW